MQTTTVFVQAHGKINLTLDVLGKRPDGYHNLRSVMQSIGLYDRLSLTATRESISIVCRNRAIPHDSSNLACRAAFALKEAAGVKAGVKIRLNKGIPVAAGLGGGSADAAAVLRGLNRLWNTGLSSAELREIGKNLGADVPFCLEGGTVLAEGYGERLTPLKPAPRMWLVLFKPEFGVSTPEVYNAYDTMEIEYRNDTAAVVAGLEKHDLEAVISGMGNMLQQTTAVLYPQVAALISGLEKMGTEAVLMCGSGPTVCAVFHDRKSAESLRNKCSNFKGKIYLCHTVSRGSFLLERNKRGEKVGRKKAYTDTAGKL